MTRINLIPPDELTDQHLVAEYREMLMVPAALKRTLTSKRGLDITKIPKQYTLNAGHVMFFYDKGLFLSNRYKALVAEMKARGMNPDPERLFPLDIFPVELQGDYVPIEQEIQINRERIQLRIDQKPQWYRKTKRQ